MDFAEFHRNEGNVGAGEKSTLATGGRAGTWRGGDRGNRLNRRIFGESAHNCGAGGASDAHVPAEYHGGHVGGPSGSAGAFAGRKQSCVCRNLRSKAIALCTCDGQRCGESVTWHRRWKVSLLVFR